jgi:hypothetical protein
MEIGELLVRNIDAKGADRGVFGRRGRILGQQADCCRSGNTHDSETDKTAAFTVNVF